jgi:tRNA threonylcarbamoyladenosine biosynthesis protein TsaB
MKLLALDTSTLVAGVAVSLDERVVERRATVTTHSEALLGLIDEALRAAGLAPAALDGVVCGAGPGSFTGLRIGLATAKGLCFALGRPLALVSSLAALAARAPDGRVCATLDAHKAEVYAGLYRVAGGLPTAEGDEQVLSPTALVAALAPLAADAPLVVVGEGARRYPELVVPGARLLDDDGAPHPADLLRLGALRLQRGEADDLGTSGPRYIRPSEAELVKMKTR